MNLTRALDVALPEIPARTLAQRYPRPDPGVTFREHVEDGKPVVRVYVPSLESMFKFPRELWLLIQLFDGKRSYQQIAELYAQQTAPISADDVREIAADLEVSEFWYKTPQEKNILLMEQTAEQRKQKVKKQNRYGDLSIIVFPAFNPDRFLTWLYGHTRFFYAPWCVALSLVAFALAGAITVAHWQEIGRDTLQFYNFAAKTWGDIAVLYFLAIFVVAAHEFGHAHACKHYGGRVPAMGFALVYLTPAFYTDTTEGAVKGTRFERLIIALAGIWAELLICSVMTPIWWASQPDTVLHNAAYFIMLLTGIASLLINWNPLMKLDGYYMLCESIGIADLKEDSTAFVAAWVKRHVWGLPVEVPYVPKRRRLGFVGYALASGLYSYTVLYIVARFAGNVFRNFNPDWSFLPELAVAALIFRSRIRLLANFMKFVYLDKKDKVATVLKSKKVALAAVVAFALLLVPVRHEFASGRFVLQASERAMVRAQVPGMITAVQAAEGQSIAAGDLLVRMRNLPLQSQVARGEAEYLAAKTHAHLSALRYEGLGPALVEQERRAQQEKELRAEAAQLDLTSPIAGVVITPRASDRLGAYVLEGTDLVEVAVLTRLKARIFVGEYDIHRFPVGAPARLQVEGMARAWDGRAVRVSPASAEMDPVLAEESGYRGLNPPKYYVVDLQIENPDGKLKPGMLGLARIYGERRSLLGLTWRGVSEFVRRKVW